MRKSLRIKERAYSSAFDFSFEKQRRVRVEKSFGMDCRDGILRSAPAYKSIVRSNGKTVSCGDWDILSLGKLNYFDQGKNCIVEKYAALTYDGQLLFEKSEGVLETVATGLIDGVIFPVIGLDGVPKLIAVGKEANCVCDNTGTVTTLGVENSVGAGCFFKHRLFLGVQGGKIVYSSPEDLTDFKQSVSNGGGISFPNVGGEIVAFRVLNGEMYVFFERGILRLDIAGEPKAFVSERLDYTGGKIFGRTVGACGNVIFFMASDGAYRFDGRKIERLLAHFVEIPKAETGREGCASWQDRALICYQTNGGVKTLALYNDGKDGYYLNGLAALSAFEGEPLFVNTQKVICALNDMGGDLFDGNILCVRTDFGIAGYKTLRRLVFDGEGSFALTLRTGKRILKRTVVLENGGAELQIAERGRSFSVCIEPKSVLKIRSWTAEWNTVGG